LTPARLQAAASCPREQATWQSRRSSRGNGNWSRDRDVSDAAACVTSRSLPAPSFPPSRSTACSAAANTRCHSGPWTRHGRSATPARPPRSGAPTRISRSGHAQPRPRLATATSSAGAAHVLNVTAADPRVPGGVPPLCQVRRAGRSPVTCEVRRGGWAPNAVAQPAKDGVRRGLRGYPWRAACKPSSVMDRFASVHGRPSI